MIGIFKLFPYILQNGRELSAAGSDIARFENPGIS